MNYQYKCESCGKEEVISKPVAEIDRLEKCSRCDSEMKRQIWPVGHIKNGTGWGDK